MLMKIKISTGRTVKDSDPSGLSIYIILLAGETSEGKGNKGIRHEFKGDHGKGAL